MRGGRVFNKFVSSLKELLNKTSASGRKTSIFPAIIERERWGASGGLAEKLLLSLVNRKKNTFLLFSFRTNTEEPGGKSWNDEGMAETIEKSPGQESRFKRAAQTRQCQAPLQTPPAIFIPLFSVAFFTNNKKIQIFKHEIFMKEFFHFPHNFKYLSVARAMNRHRQWGTFM